MSSDQTPDMPDTRWSPTEGLCTRTEDDEYGVQWWPLLPYRPGGTGPLPSEPPADAVRLVSESPFATDPQIRLEVALSAAHEGMRKQAAEIERLKAELERLARWEETGSLTIQRLNAELAELSARFGLSEDRGDNRCPSCEHRISMHGDEGCVQEIDHGPGDEPCCCPCAVEVDGTAQARDQAGTGDTAQPGGEDVIEQALEPMHEVMCPCGWELANCRGGVDPDGLRNLARAVVAAAGLLATHPDTQEAKRWVRTDRHFPVGSPEPDDLRAVISEQNYVVFRRGELAESRTWYASKDSGGDGLGYTWWQMNAENAAEGGMPLTEVRQEPGQDSDAEDENDPEEFCSTCFAGLESPEHHEKCVEPSQDTETEDA
jgi:hypothetical protein